MSYFLQMGRLAPVQCLFWGNPITSGKAGVDYFISGDRMELPHRTRDIPDAAALPASSLSSSSSSSSSSSLSSSVDAVDAVDASWDGPEGDFYSEQVVLLAGQGIWFAAPELPVSLTGRAPFGLGEGWTVYACPQSLFKLHPSFDLVLRDVLLGDRNGHVVLTHDRRPRWTKQFARRLRGSFAAGEWYEAEAGSGSVSAPNWREAADSLAAEYARSGGGDDGGGGNGDEDESEEPYDGAAWCDPGAWGGGVVGAALAQLWQRVHFVPRQSNDGFLQLLAASDVVLHPFPFDGSRTASEALALGKPVVTLPTDQLRGRMGWALYRTLGLPPELEAGVVARDRDGYVDNALRLGRDKGWRQAVGGAIAANAFKLWEDKQTVFEWAAFLATAAGRRPPTPRDLGFNPPGAEAAAEGAAGSASLGSAQVSDGGRAAARFHGELPGPEPPRGDGFSTA